VLDLLGAALEGVRAGADPRTQLELALVKAATPQADGSTRALLARIERLEQALAGNSAPPSPQSAAPPPPSSPPPPPPPSVPVEESEPAQEPEPAQVVEVLETPAEQPAAAPVAIATVPALNDLDALWPAVHESVRAENGLLGAVFNEAVPVGLTDEELTLAFAPTAAFLKRKAEDASNRAILIDALRRLTGRRYRVSFELSENLPSQEGLNGGSAPTEEEIVARLVAELDAEELPEDWLQQQKGGD
jgi:DNA polymerase III subunit gamma/tau